MLKAHLVKGRLVRVLDRLSDESVAPEKRDYVGRVMTVDYWYEEGLGICETFESPAIVLEEDTDNLVFWLEELEAM